MSNSKTPHPAPRRSEIPVPAQDGVAAPTRAAIEGRRVEMEQQASASAPSVTAPKTVVPKTSHAEKLRMAKEAERLVAEQLAAEKLAAKQAEIKELSTRLARIQEASVSAREVMLTNEDSLFLAILAMEVKGRQDLQAKAHQKLFAEKTSGWGPKEIRKARREVRSLYGDDLDNPSEDLPLVTEEDRRVEDRLVVARLNMQQSSAVSEKPYSPETTTIYSLETFSAATLAGSISVDSENGRSSVPSGVSTSGILTRNPMAGRSKTPARR